MQRLSPQKFLNSPYGGFILKPIRHDFSTCVEWLNLAQRTRIPCLVGAPVCDVVTLALCDFFNSFTTIKSENIRKESFFQGEYFGDAIFSYDHQRIVINQKIYDFIERNYSLIYAVDQI